MPTGVESQDGYNRNRVLEMRGEATDIDAASASAGAATLNKLSGKITSEALTTAAAAAYTLTLTNSEIAAGDIILASVANGTNTQGIPVLSTAKAAAGSATIVVRNLHASEALNGTLIISYKVLRAIA